MVMVIRFVDAIFLSSLLAFRDCLILIGAMARIKKKTVFGLEVDLKGEEVSIGNKEDGILSFVQRFGVRKEIKRQLSLFKYLTLD